MRGKIIPFLNLRTLTFNSSSPERISMKSLALIFCGILLLGCAGSGGKIDFSKYDTNNVMSDFERERATANIFITTQPPGAKIFMDDKYVGEANQEVVNVLPGKRVITLIKGDYYYQDTLYFQPGSNGPREITLKKK
ncbi:MAG: PEGA domain-containing protein [Chitinivibrionales bacterium]|nr:PEGA domain-containing protein [Chitinivibrionales bacterium]